MKGMDKMLRGLRRVADTSIEVGIVKAKTHESGESLATILAQHEEGTSRIPKRPTLRPAVEEYKNYAASVNNIFRGTVTGYEDAAIDLLGRRLKENHRFQFGNKDHAPITEYTRRNRRSDPNAPPLLDTKTLINSVDYEIKKR